jgi:hypothetical protein
MSTLPRFALGTIALAVSAALSAQTLGEGGSAAQGSAGPQGATNANVQLEKCDAPKGTLAKSSPRSAATGCSRPPA